MASIAKLFLGLGIKKPATAQKYIEEHEYEKGFTRHYQTHLKERVEEYEFERVNALKVARQRLFYTLPILVGLVWFSYFLLFDAPDLAFLAFIFGISAWVWFVKRSCDVYQESIKSEIFPHILSFLGDFSFASEMKSDGPKNYKDFEILPSYTSESNEDLITGTYKGVQITLFESELEKESGYGKNRSVQTVFKGIMIKISMNKTFEGKTIVRKDSGSIGNWLKSKTSTLESVRLEDPEFEDEFEVYSNDQVEARYLLTPSFMQRLLDLKKTFGGKKIECSFCNESLLMLISIKRNMFEPGSIHEREDFIDDAKSLLSEMQSIFQIIDTLKLDQNIGL